MRELMVADATLRRQTAQQASASFREKLEIAKLLDRLRLDVIELPPLGDARADTLLVKSIASVASVSRLALPVGLTVESVDAAWQALKEAKLPRLIVAVPTSTVQMEYLCHKKPDAMLACIGELVAHARSLCADVEFVADDATRSDPAFLARAVETALTAGAGAVTLCDTAGVLLPEEFGALIQDISARVPALSGAVVGVECADTLSLASACAVAAMRAGATCVKTAVCDSVLLSPEALERIVRTRGEDLGVGIKLRSTELGRTISQIDWILNSRRSATSPFDSGVNDAQHRDASAWALDESSSMTEVLSAVRRLGYDLSDEDNGKVYESFRHIALRKAVGEKELDAIIASTALQVPPTYTLDSYVINCGNVITATAHLKLHKDGALLQGIGLGDGPVDASFLAIEQIVGRHYELDDFQVQAVTEGREAMGSSLVRLRSNGRLYSGNGISTDILGASIRAYLNALNKIAYEEAART